MPSIPTFATDRLILRPPSPADMEDIVALGADPEVMRYIGRGATQSRSQAACWLEGMLADARHGLPLPHPEGLPNWLTVIERQSGAFVGFATLTVLGPAHMAAIEDHSFSSGPVIEFGYRLAKRFWGKGYATEAASTLVAYGFESMRLPMIAAIVDERNAASKHIIEKLGLTRRKTYEMNGVSIDFYTLSIEEYQGNRQKRAAASS